MSAAVPSDVEVMNPPVGGSAASARTMSLKQVADLLDRDRNTILKWLDAEGAPSVRRADKSRAQTWLIDVAEFVRWMESRAATKAKGPATDDGETDWSLLAKQEHPAALEYRQLLSKTLVAEKARAELDKALARIQPLIDLMAADRAAVSSKLMGIGRQVVDRELADLPKDLRMRVEDAVNVRLRKALGSMKGGEEIMEAALALADA